MDWARRGGEEVFGYLKELLFGPPDPTREWKRTSDLFPRFDLDRASLNDVGLGASIDGLRELGPRDPKESGRDEWGWPDLGVAATRNEEDRIVEFRIHFVDGWFPPAFRRMPGRLDYRGELVPVALMTPESFVKLCGEPYWRDVDDDDGETLLFYEFPGLEWQVEFRGEDGELACLTVTTEPLLADEEQRKAYRVTKPWPPR